MLSKEFIAEQKEKLEIRKKEIEKELESSGYQTEDGDWAPKFSDWTGDAAKDNTGDEWGLDSEEQLAYEVNIGMLRNLLSARSQVEKALEKIQDGSYGICEDCNKEIDIERLKVMPEATTCLECKK